MDSFTSGDSGSNENLDQRFCELFLDENSNSESESSMSINPFKKQI